MKRPALVLILVAFTAALFAGCELVESRHERAIARIAEEDARRASNLQAQRDYQNQEQWEEQDARRHQYQMERDRLIQLWWPWLVFVTVGTCLLTFVSLLLSVAWWPWERYRAARRQEQAQLVLSDATGALPVPRTLLLSGAASRWIEEGLQAKREGHLIGVATPAPQLPASLHYAPSYHAGNRRNDAPPVVEVEPDAPTAALPGMVDLASLLQGPVTLDRILLALAPGGARIEVPATDLCHVALAGSTGGGKSNIGRVLCAQLLAGGASLCLADPHFAPIDPKSGEDWRGIASRLYRPPAIQARDIADLFAWFCEDELARRLALRRKGELWGAPLFLYVDELPAIVAKMPTATQLLANVLREGRKVDLLLITAAQDFLTKTLGSTGAIRDNFRTAFYTGGDAQTARVLLDVRGTVDDGTLGKGVALLRSVRTPQAERVRIPYASNGAIERLLAPISPVSSHVQSSHVQRTETASPLPETGTEMEEKRRQKRLIRALLKQGRGTTDIVREVYGVKSGNAFIQASKQFNERLAEMLGDEEEAS